MRRGEDDALHRLVGEDGIEVGGIGDAKSGEEIQRALRRRGVDPVQHLEAGAFHEAGNDLLAPPAKAGHRDAHSQPCRFWKAVMVIEPQTPPVR